MPAINRPDIFWPMRDCSAKDRNGLFCDSAINAERRRFILIGKVPRPNLLLCHNVQQCEVTASLNRLET